LNKNGTCPGDVNKYLYNGKECLKTCPQGYTEIDELLICAKCDT